MKQVHLGKLSVGAIGLGCMSMTGIYGGGDTEQGEQTLLRAVELGVSLFDTANGYGRGENGRLIGRVLAPFRSEVVISTKFGFIPGEGAPRLDGHPDRVEDRCNESLQRLNTDYIDLYFLHRPDPQVPIEDTVGAMARLVTSGKVRALGLCEVSAASLRKAHAVHPITAVQSEYSLWTRDPERSVLPACRELGVGFVPFSPIGRAMLTGKIKDSAQFDQPSDIRSTMPRFSGENLEINLQLVAELEQLAASLSVTPGQVALAWLLSKSDQVVPIPGTKRIAYLEENVAASALSLSAEALHRLDAVFLPEKIAGTRYGESLSWLKSADSEAF